jgi:hypothetical protein
MDLFYIRLGLYFRTIFGVFQTTGKNVVYKKYGVKGLPNVLKNATVGRKLCLIVLD